MLCIQFKCCTTVSLQQWMSMWTAWWKKMQEEQHVSIRGGLRLWGVSSAAAETKFIEKQVETQLLIRLRERLFVFYNRTDLWCRIALWETPHPSYFMAPCGSTLQHTTTQWNTNAPHCPRATSLLILKFLYVVRGPCKQSTTWQVGKLASGLQVRHHFRHLTWVHSHSRIAIDK